MTSTVRSVRVVLEADIASYVAKMKLAGHETDAAFNSVEKRLGGTNRELGNMDKASTSVSKSLGNARVQAQGLDQDVDRLGRTTNRTGSSIDKYSGRLGALVDVALIAGPALVPLGAATIPVLTASLAGLGAAAGGIGVAVLAFQGVGDAVKALDAYNLDPTVANMKKLNQAMEQLGPAGQEFTKFVVGLQPQLKQLESIAQAGLFPGLEAGITDMLTRLPLVQEVVSELAHGMGDLAAGAGHALASDEFTPFFNYLKTDAEPTLIAFASATGNVIEAVANLFVAFAPLNQDFTGGLVDATQALADWSEGLDQNNSFQSFLAYIRENGPRAVALLGSLANTFASLLEAAAPIGANILPALTQLSNIIGIIARSDLGTPLLGGIVALRLYGRAAQGIALAQKEMIGLGFASKTTGVSLQSTATGLKRLAASPAGIAAVAGAVTLLGNALADATGAKIKTDDLQRNLESLADGKNSDLLNRINNDLAITGDTIGKIAEPIHEAVTAFGLFGNTGMDNAADNIHQVDEALAQMVESGNAAEAAKIFDQIIAKVTGSIPGASHSKAEIDGLMKSFGAYGTALDNVKPSADAAAGAIDGLTGAVGANASAQRDQRKAIDEANKAMKDQVDAALAAFDAETQYRQAVKDAAAQAAKSDAGIRGSTDAALANRSALSDLAGAWNNQSAAVKNNVGRFKEAKANFIQTAEAMHVPEAAAKRLANQLLDIPRSTVAKVKADTAAAEAAIARVGTDLRNLHDRDLFIRVHTVKDGGDAGLADMHGGTGSADGSMVPKGGVYADRYLYKLAPGEEIISNRHGQADQFRADRAAGRIPGYADGGTVSSRTPTPQINVLSTDPGYLSIGVAASLKLFKNEVDKAKQSLTDLDSKMDSLASTIADKFSTDLSSSTSGPSIQDLIASGLPGEIAAQVAATAGSGGIQNQIAAQNTANSQAGAMPGIIAALKAAGVTGAELEQILTQESFANLMALAQNPALASQLASTLTTGHALAPAAGAASAQAVFGEDRAAALKELRGVRADLAELQHLAKQQAAADKNAPKQTGQAAGEAAARATVRELKGSLLKGAGRS